MWSQDVLKAFEMARQGLARSYAPYSKLHVSAVFKSRSGHFWPGVNVENASFGGTICAERSALVSAVSLHGAPLDLEFGVILSDWPEAKPIPPCGLCLQVISEFAPPDLPLYLGGTQELKESLRLKDLLPQAFRFKSPL